MEIRLSLVQPEGLIILIKNRGVLGQAREKRHGIAMIPVDREVLLVEAVCGKIENVVAGSLRKSWDGSKLVEQEKEQR